MTSNRFDQCIGFLNELNAKDVQFFERDLLDHLKGTYNVLRQWQASDDLAFAGLFHAIYLTDFFKCNDPTPGNRERVRQVVGANAELIAYRYCVMNRREFIERKPSATCEFEDTFTSVSAKLTKDEDRDVAELIWANAIEQLEKDTPPFEARKATQPLFEGSRDRVGQHALACYLTLYR